MNAGQLAALIAAAFFAVAMCAAVYVLAKLAGLISAATSLVNSYQAGADDLLRRTRAAVDRADEQLARTGALADGVDEVAVSMAALSEQISAVAGTVRLIASGLGTPVLRLAAAGHGVRHALALRRPGLARPDQARPGLAAAAQVAGTARLRALPDGTGRQHADAGRPGAGRPGAGRRPRARRETWQQRTERVRAARERAQ